MDPVMGTEKGIKFNLLKKEGEGFANKAKEIFNSVYEA